jgi:hypothetical protein
LAASISSTTPGGLKAKAELLKACLPKNHERTGIARHAEDHEKLAWSLVADILAL